MRSAHASHSGLNVTHAQQQEPLAVSIADYCRLSGDSRSQTYNLIRRGELDARKAGKKTIIIYASAKARILSLPKLGGAEDGHAAAA